DSRLLHIDLSPDTNELERRRFIRLREAHGLKGVLERSDNAWSLSDVAAKHLVLEGLRLVFGSVALAMSEDTRFTQVTTEWASSPSTTLNVSAATLDAPILSVGVGGMTLTGHTQLQGAELAVSEHGGQVGAMTLHGSAIALEMDGLKVTIDELQAASVAIGWGDAGLSIRGTQLVAQGVSLHRAGGTSGLELVLARVELREATLHRGK